MGRVCEASNAWASAGFRILNTLSFAAVPGRVWLLYFKLGHMFTIELINKGLNL